MQNKKFCIHCKEKESDVPIKFYYNGILVSIRFTGNICTDCAKKNWLQYLNKFAEDIILIENGKVEVDWEKYFTKDTDQKQSINYILEELGIIRNKKFGGYVIIGDGIVLNPSIVEFKVFSDEEEFRKYVKIGFSKALYYWDIFKIEKI